MRRFVLALVLGAAAAAVVGCGGSGKKELAIGECTTADPKQALTFDVKVVPCSDKRAKSKVVKTAKSSSECDVGSVSQSGKKDKTFCTVAWPPGSSPTKAGVGACTTADVRQLISVNVQLVNCTDPKAKSRISKIAAKQSQCSQGSLKANDGKVYCLVRK